MGKVSKITIVFICLTSVFVADFVMKQIFPTPDVQEEETMPASTPLAAEPESTQLVIEGFGAGTVGGTGGTLYTVTNLNDGGPCSLRDFIENKKGSRIIRFAVSGDITLQREIEILNPNVTIDGGDAPNGGICIRGNAIRVRTSEVIIRYLRFRRGPTADPVDIDSFAIQGFNGNPARNIVIDHCSFSWGDDGNLDITSNSSNVTVQWCIIAENLGPGNMLIGSGGSGDSGSGATRWTVHHNLFSNGGRNPEINTGEGQWINNVIYRNATAEEFDYFQNVGGTIGPYDTPAPRVNIVGNYFRAGLLEALGEPRNQKQIYLYGGLPQSGKALIYVKGNIGPARPDDSLPESDIYYQNDGGVPVTTTPFDYPAVTTTDALTAYTDVLNRAGATRPCRDSVDTRIVNDVTKRKGSFLSEKDFNKLWPDLRLPCSR